MPSYILNKNAQPSGEHEVHRNDGSCNYMPLPENRIDLGTHTHCSGAVAVAKKSYPNANIDGCYYCCNSCHTR